MAPITRSTAIKKTQLETESTQRKRPKRLRLYLKFQCLYCNKRSFVCTELDFSRKVGRLKCVSCSAEFRHMITENLACAEDVQAALSVGDKLRWLTAKQDPTQA